MKLEWVPALRRSRPLNRIRILRTRAALVRRGESAALLARLGRAQLAIGRDEEGFRGLRRAIELDPDALELRSELANARYNRGDYGGTMRDVRDALEVQRELAEESGLDRLRVRILGMPWTVMIGHTAFLDLYVKRAILDEASLNTTILLADRARVANQAYVRYWKQFFPAVVEDAAGVQALERLARYLGEDHTMLRFPDGRYRTLHQAGSEVEERWRAAGKGPLLQLTDEDEQRGTACLERLGVPEGAWFVGLHVREGGPPWRDIHNADVATYLDAIEAIGERGGWVVRMGNPSMRALPRRPNAVDYAHSPHRSDWMDVFLWARCRFFLGTSSGPIGVPPTFGVPCVQTNWAPLLLHWYPDDLVLPKLYFSERERRMLGFAELLGHPLGHATDTRHLRAKGVRVIDNTSEEIAEVVVEMIERLDGAAQYDPRDEGLQERFENLHPQGEFAYRPASRVGREWLRRHQDLLV